MDSTKALKELHRGAKLSPKAAKQLNKMVGAFLFRELEVAKQLAQARADGAPLRRAAAGQGEEDEEEAEEEEPEVQEEAGGEVVATVSDLKVFAEGTMKVAVCGFAEDDIRAGVYRTVARRALKPPTDKHLLRCELKVKALATSEGAGRSNTGGKRKKARGDKGEE